MRTMVTATLKLVGILVGSHDVHTDPDCILGQDEDEAINKSNILKRGDILRHAQPHSTNAYNEGPGEDELPEETE